jgi:hypothetical protein
MDRIAFTYQKAKYHSLEFNYLFKFRYRDTAKTMPSAIDDFSIEFSIGSFASNILCNLIV